MGLSATQTRFLMVTARKSNVEYQGQQINQARTALANQSADLFTQMSDLKCPTAPSPYAYVINPATNPNIDWTKENAYPLSGAAADNFEIYYAGHEPQFQDFHLSEYVAQTDNDGNILGYLKKNIDAKGNINYGTPVLDENGQHKKDENGNYEYDKTLIQEDDIKGNYFITRTGQDAAGNPITYKDAVIQDGNFVYDTKTSTFKGTDSEGNILENQDNVKLPAWAEAYNNARGIYNCYSKPDATCIFDVGTELSAIKEAVAAGTQSNIAIAKQYTSSNSLAEAQYAAAYAQYERDLAAYEQACEEINQKTEKIHQADKKLELQLKQLDTERKAIDTEYEALKKVVDKNIENTYKTFNG